MSKSTSQRKLSESVKKHIAARQFYKCNNKPGSNLSKIGDYECPLWLKNSENKGIFDISGYEIDHIIEFSVTHDDREENLQALCASCHSVKTKNFMREHKRNNQIDTDKINRSDDFPMKCIDTTSNNSLNVSVPNKIDLSNDFPMKCANTTLETALIELVNNLSVNRNYSYNDWIYLGMVLYKFGKFGIDLWKNYSKKSNSHTESEINDKMNTFNIENDLHFDNLLYLLKMDNPDYYKVYIIKFKDLINYLDIDVADIDIIEMGRLYNMGDTGLVQIYHNNFKNYLICVSRQSHIFYMYSEIDKLWHKKTINDIQLHFMKNMQFIIEPLGVFYFKQSVKHSENEEKSEQLKKNLLISKEFLNWLRHINQNI